MSTLVRFFVPNIRHYDDIANIFNLAIKPFLAIYSKDELETFVVNETSSTIEEMSKSRNILAMRNSNVILGYIAYRFKNKHCMWISSFYILPEFQRNGFGRMLLNKVELIAKENEASIIALETHRKADWAIDFYTQNGYQHIVENMHQYPYNTVLDKKPVPNRPLLGKVL